QLTSVFDMFSQAGAVTNRSKKGLGIGLALVRQIVELHQGRVEAASDGSGKGARFSLWLPRVEGVKKPAKGSSPDLARKIKGLRLLVVDDSEDMTFSLKTLLEQDGAIVFTAESAEQGWDILAREQID